MSQLVNETAEFQYPSVTICSPFPTWFNLRKLIEERAEESGAKTIEELDLEAIINNHR